MFIIARKDGQLGNQLIRSAHFIAFAIERRVMILNLALHEYADYFESTKGSLLCRYPPKKGCCQASKLLRGFLFRRAQRFASKLTAHGPKLKKVSVIRSDLTQHFLLDNPGFLETIKPMQVVFVQGYFFRDPVNFVRHSEEIRNIFTPVRKHRQNVSTLIEQARKSSTTLVGLHIRQGDYQKFLGGKYYYTIDQYVSVMERILGVFPVNRIKFVICSDTRQPEEPFKRFDHIWGTGHLVEDMYALAECDYIVGPPSSFSNWASFYGKAPIHLLYDLKEPISLESFKSYPVPPV